MDECGLDINSGVQQHSSENIISNRFQHYCKPDSIDEDAADEVANADDAGRGIKVTLDDGKIIDTKFQSYEHSRIYCLSARKIFQKS
jgi:hypothetical protein